MIIFLYQWGKGWGSLSDKLPQRALQMIGRFSKLSEVLTNRHKHFCIKLQTAVPLRYFSSAKVIPRQVAGVGVWWSREAAGDWTAPESFYKAEVISYLSWQINQRPLVGVSRSKLFRSVNQQPISSFVFCAYQRLASFPQKPSGSVLWKYTLTF